MKTKNIIIITSVVSVLVIALIISVLLSYSYINSQIKQSQTDSIITLPDDSQIATTTYLSVKGLDDEIVYYSIPSYYLTDQKLKTNFDKYTSNQLESPQELVSLFSSDANTEIVFDKNIDFKINGFQGRFFTTKYDGVEPLIVGLGNFKNKLTMIVISMRMDAIVSNQISGCTPKGGGLVDQICSKKNFDATFDYDKRIEQTQKLVIDAFAK